MGLLLARTLMTLGQMSNEIIAASNNGLSGFGKVGKGNLAFEPMKKAGLIREDGRAHDKGVLLSALSIEINKRVQAGTFV